MKRLALISFLACASAFGAATDVVVPQRDANNRNQYITIRGSTNTYEALGFNGSGILSALSLFDLTPSTGRTAGQILAVDGAATGLEWITPTAAIEDGDKGDITVSGSGLAWAIDPGVIVNDDINASASIADTKLATISTAGKVSDTALSSNVPLKDAANTLTGALTQTSAPIYVPSAMGALAVDLTKSLNTKTITGNATVTFSGSLANGQWSELRVENSGASEYTVTLPSSVYSSSGSSTVSSFTVPAAAGGVNGLTHVAFSSDGTRTRIYQGGGTSGFPNPATEALNMGAFDITNAGTVTATEFVGSISGTSNVPAGELTGTLPDDVDYGKIVTAKGLVYETTTIAATTGENITVQTGVAENTITLNEATETVVFDAQPEDGKVFMVRIIAHSSACTVTWPSTWSFVTGGLRTSFVVPANKPQLITVWRDSVSYKMSGDPQEIVELPEDTTPAITASVPIDQGAGTERTSLANIRDALGVTFSGTAATPNTDATVAVAFDRLSFYHHSGATQELDLPASAGYIGRGIAIRFGGSYTVTVDPNGSETIDLDGTATSAGEAVVITGTAGQTAIFGCDSSGWFVSGGSATFAEETP